MVISAIGQEDRGVLATCQEVRGVLATCQEVRVVLAIRQEDRDVSGIGQEARDVTNTHAKKGGFEIVFYNLMFGEELGNLISVALRLRNDMIMINIILMF